MNGNGKKCGLRSRPLAMDAECLLAREQATVGTLVGVNASQAFSRRALGLACHTRETGDLIPLDLGQLIVDEQRFGQQLSEQLSIARMS